MKELSERRLVQGAERRFEEKRIRSLPTTAQPAPILSLLSEEAAERLRKIQLELTAVKAQLEKARSLRRASRK